MARRTFFSFHFDNDIWRANQVRNCNVVAGCDGAGFFDHSEYAEAKRKGGDGIKRMIDRHLRNTSVTVVLIGKQTAYRPWVKYEIAKSIQQDNGLLGIRIHHLKNQYGDSAWFPGPTPSVRSNVVFPVYDWDGDLDRFRKAIEAAGKRSESLRNNLIFERRW
jgi:MTH538 TIR-like domain (DUF1863)